MMTAWQKLYHAPRCPRCELAMHGSDGIEEGWCLFCRLYGDEKDVTTIEIWRLQADKTVRRCTPAQLGNWQSTGRDIVASDLLDLRDGTSASLTTIFLCVDYCPVGNTPLLFETRLHEMNTGARFDHCTRRHATYEEAMAGHAAMRAHLVACDAVVCKK